MYLGVVIPRHGSSVPTHFRFRVASILWLVAENLVIFIIQSHKRPAQVVLVTLDWSRSQHRLLDHVSNSLLLFFLRAEPLFPQLLCLSEDCVPPIQQLGLGRYRLRSNIHKRVVA